MKGWEERDTWAKLKHRLLWCGAASVYETLIKDIQTLAVCSFHWGADMRKAKWVCLFIQNGLKQSRIYTGPHRNMYHELEGVAIKWRADIHTDKWTEVDSTACSSNHRGALHPHNPAHWNTHKQSPFWSSEEQKYWLELYVVSSVLQFRNKMQRGGPRKEAAEAKRTSG